jgi:hypothetical protein
MSRQTCYLVEQRRIFIQETRVIRTIAPAEEEEEEEEE